MERGAAAMAREQVKSMVLCSLSFLCLHLDLSASSLFVPSRSGELVEAGAGADEVHALPGEQPLVEGTRDTGEEHKQFQYYVLVSTLSVNCSCCFFA